MRKSPRWLRAGLIVVVSLAYSAGIASERANILLVITDDLGYGDLASFGHPVINTPHLDALAADGLTLTNYYAPSALCSPSRASLLTGRHAYRTGILSWIPEGSGIYLRDEELTLAEILQSEGYATALIGKWHLNSDLGSDQEPGPNDQGFEYFYGHNAFQIPTNHNPVNLYRNGARLGEQQGYTAQLYADEAIAWLRNHDQNKPFLLVLSMAEPHTSIENPPEFNHQYKSFTTGPIVPIPSGLADIPKDKLVARGPGEYYANITYMDEQLGRVFNALEDLDLDQSAVVVFVSDNGPVTSNWRQWFEVNAYGSTAGLRGRKHSLYEGGIKVPAIVRVPGVTKKGSATDSFVHGTDLFTTLIAIAGATLPTDRPIDGRDVTSVFKGESEPEFVAFWALPVEKMREFVIREGAWKMFFDHRGVGQELYNIDDDPLEMFNVLESHPEVAQRACDHFAQVIDSIKHDPLRPNQRTGAPDNKTVFPGIELCRVN